MNKEELTKILELHKEWLKRNKNGVRADLQYAKLQSADLRSANLRSANLQGADLQGANLRYADLRYAHLRYADLRDAHLQGANLRSANLQDANLQNANLDFSCLPLWCGGLTFTIDEKIAKQIAYHLVNLLQFSKLNTKKIFKKEMYKWLSDSHLVTKHNQKVLEEMK